MTDATNTLHAPATAASAAIFRVRDGSRVPYAVFNSPEIYALEQERIYRGKTWNFLGQATLSSAERPDGAGAPEKAPALTSTGKMPGMFV